MNVRCSSCQTVYRVDPAKVPETGIKARCSVCSNLIPVQRSMDGTVAAAAPAPAAPRITQPPARPAAPPAPPPAPAATPAPARPLVRPSGPAPATRPQPAPAAAPQKPAAAAPPRPSAPVFRPTPGAPVQAPPVAPPRPSPAVPPAPAQPVFRAPAAPAPASTAGKHVNPFLAQDPRQKARRLARALISDMIVYQPEKRQQALKNGTLKTAFDEEIKKSWAEYVMQVGEEVANSTTFFTDALNEILAGGQKIF